MTEFILPIGKGFMFWTKNGAKGGAITGISSKISSGVSVSVGTLSKKHIFWTAKKTLFLLKTQTEKGRTLRIHSESYREYTGEDLPQIKKSPDLVVIELHRMKSIIVKIINIDGDEVVTAIRPIQDESPATYFLSKLVPDDSCKLTHVFTYTHEHKLFVGGENMLEEIGLVLTASEVDMYKIQYLHIGEPSNLRRMLPMSEILVDVVACRDKQSYIHSNVHIKTSTCEFTLGRDRQEMIGMMQISDWKNTLQPDKKVTVKISKSGPQPYGYDPSTMPKLDYDHFGYYLEPDYVITSIF